MTGNERRVAPRFKLRLAVGFVGTGVAGRGSTADLSSSGARLAGVTESVPDGTTVQLAFGVMDDSLTLRAEVVRQAREGFAVRFLETSFPESLLRALERGHSSDGQD